MISVLARRLQEIELLLADRDKTEAGSCLRMSLLQWKATALSSSADYVRRFMAAYIRRLR
jgi:hypothetical protein